MPQLTLKIASCASVATILLAVCYWLAAPLGALAASSTSSRHSNLASYDWSAKASPNLATKPALENVVDRFLRSSIESYSDLGESAELCSYHFADLRHDGFLSLVVGTGVTDRPSCRDVYNVDRTASGIEIYSSGGAIGAGGDVSSSIKDLGKDGNLEFILDDAIGSLGVQCAVNLPAIYAWTGSNYANVSVRFKDFYRQRLDSVNKEIPALEPLRGPDGASYVRPEKEFLQAEAAAIQRFLGISPEAVLDQAIRLANSNSNNTDYLLFAVNLLGNIGTPKARKYLETLAQNPDGRVAYMANIYLSRAPKGSVPQPDEFERLHPTIHGKSIGRFN